MSGIDTTDSAKKAVSDSPLQYFANLPTDQCANALWDRIASYYNEMRRTGRLALYRNSYMNFYMGWIYRASMYKSGEQGELTRSFVNHHRNLLLHIKTQTTQNKVTFKSQVMNSSSRSSKTVDLANGLAEYYCEDEDYGVDSKGKQSVEDCLIFAESSIVGLWNRFKGRPVVQDPVSGFVYRDGDMDYFCVTPMDQIINTSHQDRDSIQWRVIRRWVNKYDWAARYPKFASQTKNLSDTEGTYGTKLVTLIRHDEETIPVFYFFHPPTSAVPKGRLMILADPSCIYEDGPLDQGEGKPGYDHVPVYDMIVSTMNGSPFGYTVSFDLIPQQQLYNEIYSALATNNINFATQCVIGMKGGNLHYQNLASGMSYIEYDPKVGPNGKPEPLNLLSSKPESYGFLDRIRKDMEITAGIDSLSRGQVDANITSGQYAALVTTQSVIFNSGIQKAYARMLKQLMTGTIRTIRKNMIGSKVASIMGPSKTAVAREFSKMELSDIKSVNTDLINPMIQTPAGKMNMADNLMKTGLIKDPQQYLAVYTEGDLPNLFNNQESQLKLIKEENEALMRGEKFGCNVLDFHVSHILQHRAQIDTFEARKNPNADYVVATLLHIQDHLVKLAGGINPFTEQPEGPINPILAGIIGDPAVPPGTPSQVQLPPMAPPVPGGPPPPAGGPGPGAGPQAPPPGPEQVQSPAGMPAAPSNMTPDNGLGQPGGAAAA
jgi:hypothetical protein